MNWFEQLFGFTEQGRNSIYQNLRVEGNKLHSSINGKSYQHGHFETPTLSELRTRTKYLLNKGQKTTISEIVADVQTLHCSPEYKNALFQVASQCNMLEMVGPNVTPERGITGYWWDRTQGPACAIAAGAGTLYRNYFAEVNGQKGQTANNQIDSLHRLGKAWGNNNEELWSMQNGYALATKSGLKQISQLLQNASSEEKELWLGELEIGLQWNTEVTLNTDKQLVSQAYCSAMPVAYSSHSSKLWKDFAKFILDGAYEATVLSALQNREDTGSNILCLTLLGGGAFGNESQWISDAILRSLSIVKNAGLDVRIVSYGRSQSEVRKLIKVYQANQ